MGEERLLGGPCSVCGRLGKDIDFGDDAWWDLYYEEDRAVVFVRPVAA